MNFDTDLPYIENLTSVAIHNIGNISGKLGFALRNRVVALCELGASTSRSHMLIFFDVEQRIRDGYIKRSKLTFGCLSSSEERVGSS